MKLATQSQLVCHHRLLYSTLFGPFPSLLSVSRRIQESRFETCRNAFLNHSPFMITFPHQVTLYGTGETYRLALKTEPRRNLTWTVQSGDSLDFLCFRKAKTRGFN
jgi:hypothetical protein